ncbi:hypothetical protein XMM379_001916 [Aliiroseovarius sp. xm-m-379]|uniref:hypothetical protein n=1 Tax=unclassified Aliiroseovarius TaxID=2623558 RepID=UPI00156907D7|nr:MULTISPECIES: hypothetical protein [unclassified Aliiroseovarius]NRP25222.1 hypothetical protein [Aliiroseovarius sp. xm-m-379]NRP34021.1 hypothetical protein [Aliiroseovarius sp. xm-a-104]NRP50801.1 hypothetical protein [Aliiroseovarius sp. xm-m-354]NRQ05553.1 hypothetical protein [Aliiroseovarius sp. xm-m-309]NRQ08758.1 hypothetical protein [Aliiroseovarius sp. xm-v-201]
MDEYENNSGKFRQALDVLNDRFRLRWKNWWSVELWQKLKALADTGRTQDGLQYLPNNAPNLQLVSYAAFNPMLLLNEEDVEDDDFWETPDAVEQKGKRALSLTYAWDVGGAVLKLTVYTENGAVLNVAVDDDAVLETLVLDDAALVGQLAHSARVLLP